METNITSLMSLAVTENEKRLLEIILKKDEEIASLRAEKDQEIATLLTKIDELTSKLAWVKRQVFCYCFFGFSFSSLSKVSLSERET